MPTDQECASANSSRVTTGSCRHRRTHRVAILTVSHPPKPKRKPHQLTSYNPKILADSRRASDLRLDGICRPVFISCNASTYSLALSSHIHWLPSSLPNVPRQREIIILCSAGSVWSRRPIEGTQDPSYEYFARVSVNRFLSGMYRSQNMSKYLISRADRVSDGWSVTLCVAGRAATCVSCLVSSSSGVG